MHENPGNPDGIGARHAPRSAPLGPQSMEKTRDFNYLCTFATALRNRPAPILSVETMIVEKGKQKGLKFA
jgi:hypothetical protein